MRILTLTNLYPNVYQPSRAAFTRDHVAALGRRHPLRVIAPVLWTDKLQYGWKHRAFPRIYRPAPGDSAVVAYPTYYYVPKMFRRYYGAFYLWSVKRCFLRVVKEFAPTLLFAPWAYPDGWAAVRLGRLARLPVVIMVHGSDVHSLNSYPGRLRATVDALGSADAVVAVSRQLARQVIGLGVKLERVNVVYGGVDRAIFSPGPKALARAAVGMPPHSHVLLFVGNFVHVKGLDVLVEACASLARLGSPPTCYLLGDGPLRPAIQQLVDRHNLNALFHFVGTRPHESLPDWYRAADLLVLPSRSEGLPTVLLEATACGTPFVATAVGGIPEIAANGTSCLIPPDNPDLLAAAIQNAFCSEFRGFSHGSAPMRDLEDVASDLSDVFAGVSGSVRHCSRWENPVTLGGREMSSVD